MTVRLIGLVLLLVPVLANASGISPEQMREISQVASAAVETNPSGGTKYYYGIGIMVGPLDASPAWFHTGGQSGASTLLFWFPDWKVAVALMTNRDGAAIREGLARKIGEIATR
jgi:hypothetical protein